MTVRGQAHTLEAFVAALLVLSGISFALGTTAVTPLSASTSNQHVGNQERAAAVGVLEATEADGSLAEAVVYWNTTPDDDSGEFYGANNSDGTGYATGPPNEFGRVLNETFGDRRAAFNVAVVSFDRNGSRTTTTMVRMGVPSDDAVTATRQVVLYDDTTLSSPELGNVSAAATDSDRRFYASDIDPGNRLFNVVEVRITVWRI